MTEDKEQMAQEIKNLREEIRQNREEIRRLHRFIYDKASEIIDETHKNFRWTMLLIAESLAFICLLIAVSR